MINASYDKNSKLVVIYHEVAISPELASLTAREFMTEQTLAAFLWQLHNAMAELMNVKAHG